MSKKIVAVLFMAPFTIAATILLTLMCIESPSTLIVLTLGVLFAVGVGLLND